MRYLIIIIALSVFTSCSKLTVDDPEFNVSTLKSVYKAKSALSFDFIGKPDNIVFYSGEPGRNYDFINRTVESGKPQLEFSTYLQNKGEINTLKLFVSTDFSGVYDKDNVLNASWVDVTSRIKLSTGTDNTSSTVMDLTEFDKGKPIYFAFRYLGYNDNVLLQPKWTLKTFNVSNLTKDGKTTSIAKADNTGWFAIDFKNTTTAWATPVNGLLTIDGTGVLADGKTKDDNDDWVISKAIDLKKVTPDVGTSIQDIGNAKITKYAYTYANPGVYTATFVAFNRNVNEQKAKIIKVQITIEP